MRVGAAQLGIVVLLALVAGSPAARAEDAQHGTPLIEGRLNTIKDVQNAVRKCWRWPPISDISTGMDLTIMLSFRRNGEIFGGRVTYQSANVSEQERAVYYTALAYAIRRCSPLPISEDLGNAIAGRRFTFRFNDTRKQKKA
jgi:hypothetical protein